MTDTPENFRTIGHGQPCFVIAEAGVNHNGSVETALELCDAAHAAGADMVKFQAFKAEALVTAGAEKADYQKDTTGKGTQADMLRDLELSADDFQQIQTHCDSIGITFAASPFDVASLEMLVHMGVGLIKLGSGEITNRPLIEAIARTGLPTILSTGASDLNEVTRAVGWFQLGFRVGAVRTVESSIRLEDGGKLVLLHCVSAYPTQPEWVNLRAMDKLRSQTFVPVGFSDHSTGIEVPAYAVAAGACVIEKHLTLDCKMKGPDHAASIEPLEFKQMVEKIRYTETLLGKRIKQSLDVEQDVRKAARKSVYTVGELKAGHMLTRQDLAILRPGPVDGGYQPWHVDELTGRELLVDLAGGTALTREHLTGQDYTVPNWHQPRPPKDKPV